MNNILKTVLILFFLTNCSLNSNSKFWSHERIKEQKIEAGSYTEECKKKFFIKKCKKVKKLNIKNEFKKEKVLNSEFNSNLKISLHSKPIKKSFINKKC